MMRTLVFLVCVVCVATVLSGVVGLSFLWMRGQLTADTIADVRAVLAGTSRQTATENDSDQQASAPSHNDVVAKRSVRVWDLDRRQKNAAVILSMVNTRAARLTKTEQGFESRKKVFLTQLQTLTDKLNSTSTEQARGILEKLPPADAVRVLMAGTLDENIMLVQGLPDETVATLLQEFQASPDKIQVDRGQSIFQAISQGELKRRLLQNGKKQFGDTPAATPKAGKTP